MKKAMALVFDPFAAEKAVLTLALLAFVGLTVNIAGGENFCRVLGQ